MSEEITVYQPTGEVSPYTNPQQEVERAHKMAKVLQDVVRQAKLSKAFTKGGKEHLFFEAWQTIGRFFNCAPEIEWSRPIMHNDKVSGWEARAVVRNATGGVMASAESMCAKDEPNWASRPAYAVRSMAQTRASSKALRQAFAWVAVLAGYAATPAEEMDGIKDQTEEPTPQPERKVDPPPAKPEPEDRCTKEQREKIFGKAMGRWNDRDKARDFYIWMSAPADYLTKGEATDLINRWDECVADYEGAQG